MASFTYFAMGEIRSWSSSGIPSIQGKDGRNATLSQGPLPLEVASWISKSTFYCYQNSTSARFIDINLRLNSLGHHILNSIWDLVAKNWNIYCSLYKARYSLPLRNQVILLIGTFTSWGYDFEVSKPTIPSWEFIAVVWWQEFSYIKKWKL